MSYAITSEEGKHLGFLLLAGDEAQGDCIFRSLPRESEQFDSVEYELLFNLQNAGEFQYRAGAEGVLISHGSMPEPIALNRNDLNIGPNVLKVVKLENS
ncbi:hypothetical protein CS022_24505 [Veronia nyctiphanis]|uniref:Uncharacterized protein n=1 Tax=Veronia nyctiphanis TaxID=1278244 RepID=A0A4Q0Y941_9GAMM|nr:hypothetical protein [Veronia nyctiphanis]RXJ66756.1 hypothetical protein CS022_24505 [Veronia nyctiphanis]